jgi:uncharacterized RDD family membrane protein YckC
MYCPNCERLNADDAKYCMNCLTDLKTGKSKWCPVCKEMNPLDAEYCNACGHDLGRIAVTYVTDYDERPAPGDSVYAGFWLRLLALIIDDAIMSTVRSIFAVPLIMAIPMLPGVEETTEEPAFSLFSLIAIGTLIFFLVLEYLYYALMESSSLQGTLGKVALNIVVTDLDGNRISFGRASGRFFGRILSAMIFYIGFLMVAFTPRQQALHDMLAGCLVIRKKPESEEESLSRDMLWNEEPASS